MRVSVIKYQLILHWRNNRNTAFTDALFLKINLHGSNIYKSVLLYVINCAGNGRAWISGNACCLTTKYSCCINICLTYMFLFCKAICKQELVKCRSLTGINYKIADRHHASLTYMYIYQTQNIYIYIYIFIYDIRPGNQFCLKCYDHGQYVHIYAHGCVWNGNAFTRMSMCLHVCACVYVPLYSWHAIRELNIWAKLPVFSRALCVCKIFFRNISFGEYMYIAFCTDSLLMEW